MEPSDFPAFIRNLPQADLPFPGLRGWLLQSERGQVMFNEADVEVIVPEHAHGCQWGVVLDGRIDLTIDGRMHTYARGDTYSIAAGTPHAAHIYPGFRAIDYFADPQRYRVRAHWT